MRFGKAVVKHRILILILTAALLVPSVFGMIGTRVNYDMLTYLPEDIDTVIGQNELLKDFNKGAFTFLIFEDMPNKDVAALKQQVEQVEHYLNESTVHNLDILLSRLESAAPAE